jgi:UDP-2,3-diacylglucosamine pyrophosphatase LpxH
MMSKALLFSDIHLTDNTAHEYRWACMAEAAKWAASPQISMVIIGGDILDAKDRHSSALVNRTMDCLHAIAAAGKPVLILVGNHDYVDLAAPFFRFLRYLPNVIYVDKPQVVEAPGGYRILAVPHGWSWDEYTPWRLELPLYGGYDFILAHQTFCGATVNGDGKVLDKGPSPSLVDAEFTGGAPVVSGDIHQEQVLGNIVYIGSPHPVSFGETTARFLTYNFETKKFSSIRRATVQRLVLHFVLRDDGTVIEDPKFTTLCEGDHVQIHVSTTQAGLLHYPAFRNVMQNRCEQAGVVVFKLQAEVSDLYSHVSVEAVGAPVKTDREIFAAFCEVNEVPLPLMEVGVSYVSV